MTERLWSSRDFRPGDEAQLLQLTEEATEKRISEARWRWLFIDNPSGQAIFKLAEHGDRLVGQYVVAPQRMVIEGTECLAAQSLETMTHPDYRRQGMFVTLARLVYENALARDIPVIYGFPNTQSHHGFVNRLEFFDFDVPIYLRPMRAERIFPRYIKTQAVGRALGALMQSVCDRLFRSRMSIEVIRERSGPVERFGAEHDRLWDSVKGEYPNWVKRDAHYLNWRYFEKIGEEYECYQAFDRDGRVTGWIVLKSFLKDGFLQGHIVDLLCSRSDRNTLKVLLGRAMMSFREEGVDFAACMMLPHAHVRPELRKLGFVLRGKHLPYIVRINDQGWQGRGLRNIEGWYIMIGDADFI